MSSLVAWICCTDRIITTISLGGKLELSMWKKFEYRLILWTLRVGDLLLCHVLALQNPKSEPRTLKPPSNSLQKLLLILVVIMCITTPNLATQTEGRDKSYSQLPAVQLAPWAPSLPHITSKTCTAVIQTHKAVTKKVWRLVFCA